MNASKFTKLALAVALAFPMLASAESNFVTGASTSAPGAQARLDFQITIPKVLYLQVGTGTYFTNVGTVNLIDFTVPAVNVGDASLIASSPASVAVRVVGNNGNITLNATTAGALGNGSGDTISFTADPSGRPTTPAWPTRRRSWTAAPAPT